jgi:hypothetical protein
MEKFEQFSNTPAPKGFYPACHIIDTDVFDYISDVGMSVYAGLDGKLTDPEKINLGDDIAKKLAECDSRLHDLIAHTEKLREVARLLVEYLKAAS